MSPPDSNNLELRGRRIASRRERHAPEGNAYPGNPREWERDRYGTATLTPLKPTTSQIGPLVALGLDRMLST